MTDTYNSTTTMDWKPPRGSKKFFNRPRPCPGCGELVYPADEGVVFKRATGAYPGEAKESYYCGEACYDRATDIVADRRLEPLLGEALDDGFSALDSDYRPDDCWSPDRDAGSITRVITLKQLKDQERGD